MLNMRQRQRYHRAVIHIGIELIIELEVPSPGLAFTVFDFPIPGIAHLLLQDPVGALDHSRIIGRNTAFAQSKQSVGGIPYRRLARLHAEAVTFLNSQLVKFIQSANYLWIIK